MLGAFFNVLFNAICVANNIHLFGRIDEYESGALTIIRCLEIGVDETIFDSGDIAHADNTALGGLRNDYPPEFIFIICLLARLYANCADICLDLSA